MYSMKQKSCTVWNKNHVQYETKIMYSMKQKSCTVWNKNHVQYETKIMYSMKQKSQCFLVNTSVIQKILQPLSVLWFH